VLASPFVIKYLWLTTGRWSTVHGWILNYKAIYRRVCGTISATVKFSGL
jgi:hypothetical protein